MGIVLLLVWAGLAFVLWAMLAVSGRISRQEEAAGLSAVRVAALSDAGRQMALVERLRSQGFEARPGVAERGYMWTVQLPSGNAVQVIRQGNLEALEALCRFLGVEP